MIKLTEKECSQRTLAVVLFVVSLVLNGLASTTLLGGNTTADVSDSYPNLFTPAGVTFAIWGIIYLLLLGYCVRLYTRFGQKQNKPADKLAAKIMPSFVAVSALNAAWIIAWQYRIMWLSVLLIAGMLVALAYVAMQLRGRRLSFIDWVLIKLPFSIYFGWITVAAIANVTVFLVSIGWDGLGPQAESWTVVILGLGAIIGAVTAWRVKNWAYLAVFLWAYFGIWLKHTSAIGFNGAYPILISLLVQFLAVLAVTTAWVAYMSSTYATRNK